MFGKSLKNKLIRWRDAARSLKYYRRYSRFVLGRAPLSGIEVISVEFCSVCNLRCRYCFLERKERPAFLDTGIYKKLLEELCNNKEYKVRIMEWPISGCFFLHPRYREIIRMTKEFREAHQHFNPWIILNDNMMLFDKEAVDFVLKEGVVDQIICSLDGVDRETFEYMRPGADFEKVVGNIEYLLQKNRESGDRAVIQLNCGRDEKCAGKKPGRRLKKIFGRADRVSTWEPVDWNESFHKENPRYSPGRNFCSFVFEAAVISASGAVIKCCMDLKEDTKYGDFNRDSLEAIWHSQERRSFLEAMYRDRRSLLPGCRTCSIGYVSQNKFPRRAK